MINTWYYCSRCNRPMPYWVFFHVKSDDGKTLKLKRYCVQCYDYLASLGEAYMSDAEEIEREEAEAEIERKQEEGGEESERT